tara:strand:- start:738 stop:890 length:153 start_codon:yes stop_codon:yes gene_type:complete
MQNKQKFGLSFEELATRETVYKENLLNDHSVLITGAVVVWVKQWLFFLLD